MSISLEKLTQILATIRISSSLQEEILKAIEDEITLLEANIEQLTFEEFCILDEEHLFELEIEEDGEGILGDQNQEVNHAYGSFIEQWFQATIRLDQFCFCFYFVKLHFQQ